MRQTSVKLPVWSGIFELTFSVNHLIIKIPFDLMTKRLYFDPPVFPAIAMGGSHLVAQHGMVDGPAETAARHGIESQTICRVTCLVDS